jgi:hypothetical protein
MLLGIISGCSGNHAIQCAMIGEQKICFVREVWGFNGENLSLTTSDNVCHKPSNEDDYVSDRMRGDDVIFAKIVDGKFYVYAVPMKAPKNPFPVEVISEPYNPATYFGRDFIKDGYQRFDLSKENMTWCLNDIF